MTNVAKSKITKCQEGKQQEDAEDLILKVLHHYHVFFYIFPLDIEIPFFFISAVSLQTLFLFTDDWVYTDRSNEETSDILDLMGAQLEPPPLASTTFSTSASMRSK